MEDKLTTPRKRVEDFLNQTESARYLSERDRDYCDNKQWTQEEEAKLRSRNQAAITINRIKPKVEGLKGLLINRRTDPKAYPRTQAHQESAEVVTDALRYVADKEDLDGIELDVADNVFVEGYGGAIVDVKQAGKEIEIDIECIPWDRIYFDPHSRKIDFSDANYMGIIIWMDKAEAEAKFKTEITTDSAEFETFEDRPRWIDTKRNRVRICQHFEQVEEKWEMSYFAGDKYLVEPKASPYLDEDGEPTNPIELVSAHIDRDNNRFGEVRYWIDPQDEINHRRSKALHLLSVRQTSSRKGAVSDIDGMKRELAKPDGHVEYEGEKGDFEVLPTGDMAQAQFQLLEEAKRELDAIGFNAQLSGERQGDLSGKAVNLLQQAGTLELASTYSAINQWKKRIYRQIWYRIRQFWDKERWVRVTDDFKDLKWVGFNVPATVQSILEEKINDETVPEFERKQAAQMFMQMMQAKDPRLQEVVEIKNPVAKLDMDIILDHSPNMINVQQEQFELMANLAANRPEIPFTALLKLSEVRDKEDLIDQIEEGEKRQAEVIQANAEAEQQKQQGEMQAQMQLEQFKSQAKVKADFSSTQQKIQSEEKIKAAEIAGKRELVLIDIDADREKALIQKDLESFRGESTAKETSEGNKELTEALHGLTEARSTDVDKLVAELQRPKQIVRDESGNVIGLQ